MSYFKENYNFSKVPGVCPRGSSIFGWGPNFFQGGGGGGVELLVPIKTNRTCHFSEGGGSGPTVTPRSAHAYHRIFSFRFQKQ